MPKKCADYPARLDLHVSKIARIKLISIAYQMGHKGEYAKSVRKLLDEAIERYEENLDPREKADFELIVMNVRMAEG